ncbi:MAG: hypothetical protein IJ730_04745 [Alphaproteobacteria bacterium]|nr:hypothetical protein [Alphaproteobacteria bacterium]MBR2137532.1 hypothetical protein [Alphaproteobacteria bacterium]
MPNIEKIKEVLLFFQCRAGLYPFSCEEDPIHTFFGKLMMHDRLNLGLSKDNEDMRIQLNKIIDEMGEEGLLASDAGNYLIPARDYDWNKLTGTEYLILKEWLHNMLYNEQAKADMRRKQNEANNVT